MTQLIVKHIHSSLLKNQKTLSVAESCTGGLLSKLLTDISGSSKYFILGVVAYSNQAKINILKIPAELIAKQGVVSQEVVQKMAESVRKLSKTDFGISITGIAGPTGGTTQKPVVRLCSPQALSKAEVPVGTVFIAINSKNKKICKKFHFTGNRPTVRKKAALKTLKLLKNFLL